MVKIVLKVRDGVAAAGWLLRLVLHFYCASFGLVICCGFIFMGCSLSSICHVDIVSAIKTSHQPTLQCGFIM